MNQDKPIKPARRPRRVQLVARVPRHFYFAAYDLAQLEGRTIADMFRAYLADRIGRDALAAAAEKYNR